MEMKTKPLKIIVTEIYCKDGIIKIPLKEYQLKLIDIVSEYIKDNSCKSFSELSASEIQSLVTPVDKDEFELNIYHHLLSIRQMNILKIQKPINIDKEDMLEEIKKLRIENRYLKSENEDFKLENEKLKVKNEYFKSENEDLKHYRDYYKAVFADTFDQFEDHDNAYFNNLKELFKMYMIADEKLNPKALPLKYQLYAFVIFISNYIKEDEFYGYILRYMLYNSKNFSNNLEDYKELDAIIKLVVDTDNHKLLKQVIQDNITKKY